MSYNNTGNKEHGFKLFEIRRKEGNFKNIVLFHGSEGYLINWGIDSLVKKYVATGFESLDYTKIDSLENDINDLEEASCTISMFSQKRIICVNNFFHGKSKLKKEKELLDVLDNLGDGVLVIFTLEDDIKDREKKYDKNFLTKYIKKNGETFDFSQLDKRALQSFIKKRFKSNGVEISPQMLSYFIEESGYYTKDNDYGLYNITNDIEKITYHCDGNVTKEDIDEILTDSIEHNIFAFLDSISNNNKEESLRLLQNMLLSGVKAPVLLSMISSQIEIILIVKEMKEEGVSFKEMVNIAKVHEFRIKKALNLTNRYTIEKLKRILIGIYSCEEKIKSGRFSQELALELFISQI